MVLIGKSLMEGLARRWRLQIVLVDDGSPDKSAAVCRRLHQLYPQHISAILLSRNFREHNAVMAGLNCAQGDYCVLRGVYALPKSWRVLVLGGELLLGIEGPMDAAHSQGTARDEANPWSGLGEKYRRNFRALDKAFREVPKLKEAETFATLSHEVNFLLAAFHNKRAYLPEQWFHDIDR